METQLCSSFQLPPGFRFHPSDEELILHYLKTKATSNPFPPSIIADVELYKFDPWELPKKAFFGEEEWYFFTPRDRKYPKGARPNRMASSGYWKATGSDRPVFDARGSRIIGVKKALVFYKGRPPRGVKTEWIMDEYRLLETISWTANKKEPMRLDNWVLCRVRQKSCNMRNTRPEPVDNFQSSTNTNPNTKLLRGSLFKDCPMLPFIFGSQTDFFETEKVSSTEEDLQSLIAPYTSADSKKRRNGETNQEDGLIQFQPAKKTTKRDDVLEDLLDLSKDDEVETDIFNADQWNFMMQYQDFDHITLA